MKIVLLTFILNVGILKAKEDQNFKVTKEVSDSLEKLRSLPPEDFVKGIDDYRDVLSKYIKYKKLVCKGEFSAIILDEKNSEIKSKTPSKKLTIEEQQLCFRELKAIQFTFINNLFNARKRYLSFAHKQKIEQLEKAKFKSIENLQLAFSREEKSLSSKAKKKNRRKKN